jgi:hypothetical protein
MHINLFSRYQKKRFNKLILFNFIINTVICSLKSWGEIRIYRTISINRNIILILLNGFSAAS